METIFLTILNLSIKASWLILAVLILRYLFRSTSKNFRILLWGLAGIRLIFPFSFESIFSLIPSKETVPSDIAFMEVPAIDSGIPAVDQSVNPVLAENFTPSPVNSANPLQVWNYVLAWIWVIGVCFMIGYLIISSYRLHRKISKAAMREKGLYEDTLIPSPFVFGIFDPKICLPSGIAEPDRTDILRHERMHIRRRDTLTKLLAFLILAVHWFNPLVWLSWHLLCRDIELACDEAVLDELNEEEKKQYAKTVLDSAYGKTRFAVSPVSFQETGTKERIRNMIRYRKPSLLMAGGALLICALAGCAFLSDPAAEADDPEEIFEPAMSGISLIRTGAKDIWCLKDENLLQAAGLNYTVFSESEVEKVLYECEYPWCDITDGMPAGSIFDTLTFENYDGQVSRMLNRCILIQMNDDQADELARKLDLCQVSFTVQDTDTYLITELAADVQVMYLEDLSYGPKRIPLLRNLLSSQIFIQTSSDEGVLLVPSIEDDTLYYGMQYIKNKQVLANHSMRIIPDDPAVFDSLERVFKGTLECSSEYYDDGEIHWHLKPGRYGVAIDSDRITFLRLDENGQIIADSGVEFSFYTP